MLKNLIEKLIDHQDLSTDESRLAIHEMLRQANPSQIAAFLVLMRSKGETVAELVGIVDAMEHLMVPVTLDFPVLDIVGTGGDGAGTINISTGSSILAASCGVKVAKHGNRSISSLCGSTDVLEALGISVESCPNKVVESIQKVGIGFMHAPYFHPAMNQLKAVRQGLNIRTAFNLIGPLLNPAKAAFQMVGVSHEKLLDLMALSLFKQGKKRGLVFHGSGLDELSCVGTSSVLEVTPLGIRPFTLDPRDYGLPLCSLSDLKGGCAKENAEQLERVFQGESGAIANTLVLNAGVAIYLYGLAPSIHEGIVQAQYSLKASKAYHLLNQWRSL